MSGFQRSIEAARAAVLARAGVSLPPNRGGGSSLALVERIHENTLSTFNMGMGYETHPTADDAADPQVHQRQIQHLCVQVGRRTLFTEPPRPLIRVKAPTPSPVAPSWASCAPGELLAGLSLSPTAVRVFELLHRLADEVAHARAYAVAPDAVTLHLPAGLLALSAGISRATLYRVLPQLAAAGLLAHGGQAQKVRGMGLYGGCLWAIKVRPGAHRPALRREDWRHQWRDFEADIDAGRTLKALVEEVRQLQDKKQRESYIGAMKAWALTPGTTKTPVADVGVASEGGGLLELSYRLGSLAEVHPGRRAETVTALASALAAALDDAGSKRWYAGLLWAALAAEIEGRAGLQVLAAQLARLAADRQEWAELRRPGALLASRLRSAI
jgi:hypothetical protein